MRPPLVMTPGTPLFCCPTLRPPSQERIRPGPATLSNAPRSSGTGASATGLEVGQEVRMHIDRRHRGNLRSHIFEHSNHCSAVIETSEPGCSPDTVPSVFAHQTTTSAVLSGHKSQ